MFCLLQRCQQSSGTKLIGDKEKNSREVLSLFYPEAFPTYNQVCSRRLNKSKEKHVTGGPINEGRITEKG